MRTLQFSNRSLAGITRLIVVVLVAACYEVIVPPGRAPSLITPATGTADGASLLTVVTKIDTGSVPTDKRAVTLSTTAGAFTASGNSTATLTPDIAGAATALLRAPADSTTALITATVNGAAVSRAIVFSRALPERVDVVPDRFSLGVGLSHELAVTVYLRRSVGTPSPGARVSFGSTYVSDTSSSAGLFLPLAATSDASGVVRTRFTMPDTTRTGPLLLRATIESSGLAGDATIQLTKP